MPEDPKKRIRRRDRLRGAVRGAVERAGVRALEAAKPAVRRALEVILEEPLAAQPAAPREGPEAPPTGSVPPTTPLHPPADVVPEREPAPGAVEATPLEGSPPLPPGEPPPGGPVGPGGDAAPQLMEQLSHLTVATNEIYNRLVELGYKDAAEAIVRVPLAPVIPPEEPAVPLPPVEPPIEIPEEPPTEPEGRYLLQGSNLFVPFMDPLNAWHRLKTMWEEASIGSPRDPVTGEPLDDAPPYAPDAYAKGSTLDPGVQIPRQAIVSADAFSQWAQNNGFSSGVAIEVDGLIAGPGRSVMSGGKSRRVKVPSTIGPQGEG